MYYRKNNNPLNPPYQGEGIKNKAFPASWTRSRASLGFTLVELIVVVTILAILATIGFVSYSSYLTGVRDTNRLAQLVSIHDGLELYRTKKDLPLPDESVDVIIGGSPIAYQGFAGSNTLETIDFTKGGVDPRDKTYFSYYLTADRKYFQLMAFLEEEANITTKLNITDETHAVDYSTRIPTIYGKKLGILTDTDNTPIQEIQTVKDSGGLTITSTTTGYIAHLTDVDMLKSTELLSMNPKASCKRIKQLKGGSSDGIYKINPTGTTEIEVYCDMTTDGGGWTALTRINPNINDYSYWQLNPGTNIGANYNYMNYSNQINSNEIYISKGIGWDGSEYVFENISGDLYARRGTLKDLVIKTGWTGLSTNINNLLNAYENNKSINSTNYVYFTHTNGDLNDFPFYTASTSQNDVALSNIPWGGRGFIENIDTHIFVK